VYVVPPPPVYYGQPVAVAREEVYATVPVSVEVVRVQDALRARKYYQGIVDGVNGPATKAAVRAYQIDRGLPVTGRIDGLLLGDLGL
jgi:peptidoglycan hydrolase-like protein with peptidoglycan-binding domain